MPFFIVCCLWLQSAFAKNPFAVEISTVEMSVGEKSEIVVTFRIPKDHHMYQDMMSVTSPQLEGLQFEKAVFPVGEFKPDPANPTQNREVFGQTIAVRVPVTGNLAGVFTPTFQVQYQGCRKTLCYMPKREQLQTTVTVVEAQQPDAAQPLPEGGNSPENKPMRNKKSAAERGEKRDKKVEVEEPALSPVAPSFSVQPVAGSENEVAVQIVLAEEGYVLQKSVSLRFADSTIDSTLSLTQPSIRAVAQRFEPSAGEVFWAYPAPVVVSAQVNGPVGSHTRVVEVEAQICSTDACAPPTTTSIPAEIRLSGERLVEKKKLRLS